MYFPSMKLLASKCLWNIQTLDCVTSAIIRWLSVSCIQPINQCSAFILHSVLKLKSSPIMKSSSHANSSLHWKVGDLTALALPSHKHRCESLRCPSRWVTCCPGDCGLHRLLLLLICFTYFYYYFFVCLILLDVPAFRQPLFLQKQTCFLSLVSHRDPYYGHLGHTHKRHHLFSSDGNTCEPW